MAQLNEVTINDILTLNQEFGYEFIISDGNIIGAVCTDDNGKERYIF